MSNTLTALQNLKIYREIESKGDFISATIGESKKMKIQICSRFYNITVCGKNSKSISKKYSHDDNLITSIIEMQKLASMYL